MLNNSEFLDHPVRAHVVGGVISQLSPYVWDIMSFVDNKLLDSDAVFLRDDKVLRSGAFL